MHPDLLLKKAAKQHDCKLKLPKVTDGTFMTQPNLKFLKAQYKHDNENVPSISV